MKDTLLKIIGWIAGGAIGLLIVAHFVHPVVNVQVQQPTGSGNQVLYTSTQKADVVRVNVVNTTTLGTLLNDDPDGLKRVVEEVDYYADTLGFTTTSILSVGTSTAAFATTTQNFWNSTTLTSSTLPQYLVTSTYTNAANRTWGSNQLVSIKTNNPVTSTGWLKIKYGKQP